MAYIPSGCTVKEYEEVVYSGKCDNKLYLSFGGVELENADEYCEKITGTNKILSNGNNYFSLDNFVSKELNITLHDIEIKKIIDPVNVKIGTNVNGTYIYVPIGIFNIQDSPKSAKGTIKIQLRDNSVKFDFKYNAKPLIDLNGGSATKRQILEDICTKAGVKHKIPYFLGEDDEIGIYDSTVKARVYVSYIAEQGGVFPTIDRDGDLIFVDIKDQKKVVTGETINLLNATNRELAKLTFDGRSTQETTNGDQLYDVKDVFSFSSGVTTDNDDWITISCDNTSGTSTKYFDFKTKISENVQPSTTYDLFVEIKSVSGNGTINFVSNKTIGQSATYSGNSLANLSVGTIKPTFTTKDDFTGCTNFLNSYAAVSAGQIGSITFRISVLKANVKTLDNFVYEPFTGVQPSPNPDYPSEIESIEGTVQYKQIGVQLYNNTSTTDRVQQGITTKFSNNTYYLSGNATQTWSDITAFFPITLSKGTYTISIDKILDFQLNIRFINDDNTPYVYSIPKGSLSTTFTITDDTINRAALYINKLSSHQLINTSFKFQLQAGDKALPIEEYKETILNINLQGNKLCSLSNGVKDELIVENGRAKIIKNVQETLLDGVNKKFHSIDLRGTKTFLICNYYNSNIKKAISENEVIPLSNKFRSASLHDTWNGVIQYGISQSHNGHYLQFSFPKTIGTDLTLDGLNAWLVNNNTKVQYQLETPQIIDLGEVTQPKTFDGVNNISNSENTNMSVEYLSPKEPKKLPIDYIEDYEDGEPYEISKTIYESGIIKFEDGTETNDILYLNSANPYITNLEQVKKINGNLKGLKLNSFSVSKIKGNLLIDPYDLIEVESENGKFVTLGQNTFTYDGSIMQGFSTKIGKEIRKTNVSASSEATYRKLAQTEIDNVKGEIRLYVEEQVGQVEDQINGESGINENLELIKNSIETIKSTMLKQTAEQFEMLFKQTGIEEIVNSVDNLTKDNNTKLNELEQWIRFKGASIELGRSDSQVKLMLQNDEIYFMTGGVKTGRIKDNMIFIENSIVTNSFKQGISASGQDKALWEERVETSGNKNLRWIGGAY